MTSLEKALLKFIANIIKFSPENIDTIAIYKDTAMAQWESGMLTDAEHCLIEAWLDNHGTDK